jgi:hypothetical protein
VGIETVQGTKSNTQLIANDALEYLLINDNTVADSTQTALKEFAKGDYLYIRIEIRSTVSIDIRKNIGTGNRGGNLIAFR